jgi:hypothetical protein
VRVLDCNVRIGGFLGLGPRYEDSKFDLELKIALRTYLRTD